MHINKLPSDIIYGVFRYIPEWSIESKEGYSNSLAPLSINQTWRNLGLPILYKTIFVEAEQISFNPPTSINDIIRSSNIGLIAQSKHAVLARKFALSLNVTSNLLESLCMIINFVKSFQQQWPGISTLEFVFSYSGSFSPMKIVNFGDIDSLLPSVLPNIKNVHVRHKGRIPVIETLGMHLASLYETSLREMLIPSVDAEFRLSASTQLTRIDIVNTPKYFGTLPILCPDTLIELRLDNCPTVVAWAAAPGSGHADPCAQVIRFPCLKVLDIDFRATTHGKYVKDNFAEITKVKLHFPKLEYLKLEIHDDTCPFFDYAVFPESISVANIIASPDSICYIGKIRLPEINMLKLYVPSIDSRSKDGIISSVDNMLKWQPSHCNAKLFLSGDYLIRAGDIKFKNIFSLELDAPITTRGLIDIIEYYPYLRKLDVDDLVCDDNPAYMEFSEHEEANVADVHPYDSRIEVLKLDYNNRYNDNFLHVFYHLIPRLRSLKHVWARGFYETNICIFLEDNREKYPHLCNIRTVQSVSQYH